MLVYTAGDIAATVVQAAAAIIIALPTGGASLVAVGIGVAAKLGVKAGIKTIVNTAKKLPKVTTPPSPL